MANPSGEVNFTYVPIGSSMPASPDNSTIYFLEEAKQLYVGSNPIANWGVTAADLATLLAGYTVKSVTISGTGNVITDASFDSSTGVLTLTKGTAVLTTTNQTIGGVKTFSSFPVLPSSDPTTNYQAATKKYVDDQMAAVTGPMVFKGTLGSGGTIASLPTASSTTVGYTYKVITAGTYADQSANVGDMFICSSAPAWILVPSGDEPSGTVTNVATGSGLTGGPITASGTISHGDTSSVADLTPTAHTYVTGLTFDDFGHVTAYQTATESGGGSGGTTYTFASGSNGSFTVTPSGSTAQTVSIGKPATAGAADSAVCDGDNNNIASTYVTKSELSWVIIT